MHKLKYLEIDVSMKSKYYQATKILVAITFRFIPFVDKASFVETWFYKSQSSSTMHLRVCDFDLRN